MNKGILFSKIRKPSIKYQKSFCYPAGQGTFLWDKKEQSRDITYKEAQFYDVLMTEILATDFS